jgi:PAS domain S-box-containing protein
VALFGLCRDVTDETRAQAELREREQRFATIFHASPVATVLTAAADGRVLDVNARFLEITGYRQDELIGRSVESLGIWRAEERHRMLDQLREQGSLREVALTYRTRAGLECRALAAIERLEIGGEDCLLKLLWRT